MDTKFYYSTVEDHEDLEISATKFTEYVEIDANCYPLNKREAAELVKFLLDWLI